MSIYRRYIEKKHGKIFAFLLAAVVTLTTGFSMTALAVEGDPAEGTGSAPGSGAGYSITVDKNFKGQEYTLYKLFNATTNAESTPPYQVMTNRMPNC